MKNIKLALLRLHILLSCIFFLTQCKTNTEQIATDTTAVSSDTVPVDEVPSDEMVMNIEIDYDGMVQNEARIELREFPPFSNLLLATRPAFSYQDSLIYSRNESETEIDSTAYKPLEARAYEAILDYQNQLRDGYQFQDNTIRLTELTRGVGREDASMNVIPEPTGPSLINASDYFFFLGGAPFINKIQADEQSVFTSPSGKPETHFGLTIQENASLLLNSITHGDAKAIDVQFGEPLQSYDGPDRHIRGIGSLIHVFKNRIPVSFITEKGLVSATLISIEVKLEDEGLGCVSDEHYVTFACSENINEYDILGIFIPYKNYQLSCAVTRVNGSAWVADLNNDGIPDFASVTSQFAGVISDTMLEAIWFVNINGTWVVIDWARELECT